MGNVRNAKKFMDLFCRRRRDTLFTAVYAWEMRIFYSRRSIVAKLISGSIIWCVVFSIHRFMVLCLLKQFYLLNYCQCMIIPEEFFNLYCKRLCSYSLIIYFSFYSLNIRKNSMSDLTSTLTTRGRQSHSQLDSHRHQKLLSNKGI